MSGQCTGWVLRYGPRPDHVDASGTRYGEAKARAMRAVLAPIADAANRDGEHSHPGNDAIVEGSLYSHRSCRRYIADLIADGWLAIEAEGGGRGKATVYRVVMEQKPGQGGHLSEGKPGQIGAETRPNRTETRPNDAINPAMALPLTSDDASTNVVLNGLTNGRDTTASSDAVIVAFEAFWLQYPKHRRLAKAQCLTTYRARARETGHEVIDSGLARWVAFWNAPPVTDPMYVPQITTWLSQRRWEADPGVKTRRGGVSQGPAAHGPGWRPDTPNDDARRSGPEGEIKL